MDAKGFYREAPAICRLRVPFEGIYTSVFLIEADGKRILVDCAMTAADVEGIILPALAARGLSPTDIDTLVLTHRHGDHAGGLDAILQHAPAIRVVTAPDETLADGILTYPLGGHTADSIGVLDTHTGTLISGDGLQGEGVDKYPCYTQDPEMYVQTLERILNDDRIESILFSHAYAPWNSDRATGRDLVIDCTKQCIAYQERIENK